MAWLITWHTIESDVAKTSSVIAWHIYVVYLIRYIHIFVLFIMLFSFYQQFTTDAYSLISTLSNVVRFIFIIINNTTEPGRKIPILFDIM